MLLENIYSQDSEQIDYSEIDEEDLKKLVLDFYDPEIATSALSELSIRKSKLIIDLSNTILKDSIGDNFLQSLAFKSLYEFEKNKAIEYIKNNYLKCDKRILLSIMESIIIDENYFKNNLELKIIARKAFERLKKIPKNNFNIPEDYEWVIKEFSL
ncbi:MAG: hypothetical protein AABZ74_12410 [Cyanobacteriota bacterium]